MRFLGKILRGLVKFKVGIVRVNLELVKESLRSSWFRSITWFGNMVYCRPWHFPWHGGQWYLVVHGIACKEAFISIEEAPL